MAVWGQFVFCVSFSEVGGDERVRHGVSEARSEEFSH